MANLGGQISLQFVGHSDVGAPHPPALKLPLPDPGRAPGLIGVRVQAALIKQRYSVLWGL